MRKKLLRPLALALTVLMLVSALPLQAMAADYRKGAQSGPSTSYKNGIYYENYKRVPITGDNRTDLLAIALSQLGYQEGAYNGAFSGEVSGGSNYVEYSYNLGDLGFGYGGSVYPWCASFVTWCLYQSHCTDQATFKELGRYHVGDYKYIWKEISCSQWVRQLKGAGYYKYSAYEGGSYTPKSGDLVFFQNSKGVAHIGICLYTAGGRIYTVEGNTSDAAGLEANGGGVYFKNYLLTTSYINGYGVLPYKSDSSVPAIDYSGNNPTPGLYISNANKYIYTTETGTSHSYIMDRFTMFEVTEVCSNGRLKVITKERNGSTVTGYITNNSDRVIQLSSSQNNALEAAKTNLQKAVDQTGTIRHYNYAEAKLLEIRTAYADAKSLLDNSKATAAQLNAAADNLTALITQTGSNTIALNNQGIYINGRNGFIKAGDCFIFSPTWNNGLITVDNANIRYTINVVCGWDAAQQVNVVKSITYGSGNSTPSIQLAADEFLIACHNWETGVADSDSPVPYSGTNYQILSELEIGSAVKLSGCTALNAGTDVQPGAFLKFAPAEAVMMTGRNQSVAAGNAVLLTPTFENGLLTPANANIHNTLNVLVKWDNDKSAWIVAEKSVGSGVADESSNIQLTDGAVLIAACPGTDAFSAANYAKLNAAKVGQKVIFSGITPDKYSSDLSNAANISFVDYASGGESDQLAPTNLAYGKDYIARLPGTTAHQAGLTDGVYLKGLNFDGGWFGFMENSASAAWNTDDQGIGRITMDLGERYLLSEVKLHVYAGVNEASIGSPSFVKAYVSADGETYQYAGDLVINADATESYWAAGEITASGRYVRLLVGPSDDSAWVFVNELEIYGTQPTEENIALNAAVTATTNGTGSYVAGLTDGTYVTELGEYGWFGFLNDGSENANTTGGTGSVVIDLTGRYQITDVRAHVFAGENTEGISAPKAVDVSVSPDGVNYIKVGSLNLAELTETGWAALGEDAVVGRYLKLDVTCDGTWALLNEIEVFGAPHTQSVDDNIALGKSYIAPAYPDSTFTADLTDGVASSMLQYNVNNDAWFGFYNTGDATGGNVGTNDRGIITLDLGGHAEITSVSMNLLAGANDAGATQPGYINVYVSTDGQWFEYIKTIDVDPAADGGYWVSYDCSETPAYARYVKFALSVNDGQLVLLNEIKIGGTMLTSDDAAETGTLANVTLTGTFNGWNSTPNMQVMDDSWVRATLALTAGTHEFKILHGNDWYGSTTTIQDTTLTSANALILSTEGNNCVLNTSYNGNYTFSYNHNTQELIVAFEPGTLYLQGSFNDWGMDTMMVDNGNGTYTATITLDPGSYPYCVANAENTLSWPAAAATLEVPYKADVTFVLDVYGNVITASQQAIAGDVVTITGAFNGWDADTQMEVVEGTKVCATLNLTPGSYEFQVLENGVWMGNGGKVTDTTAEVLVMTEDGGNCTLNVSLPGSYTFLYDTDTDELTITCTPDELFLYGDFNGWNQDLPMTPGENGSYSATVELDAGTYEYKVGNGSWSASWPENNASVTVQKPSTLTVTFSLDAVGNRVVTHTVTERVPKFDITQSNLTLGNDLTLYFYFGKDLCADWTGCYAVMTKPYADGTETLTVTVPFEDWDGNYHSTLYRVAFPGIAAKEMADVVSIVVYNAEGVAISNVGTGSIRNYVDKLMAAYSNDADIMRLAVDMLNYGAEAQKYFHYNEETLANAGLTAEQLAFGTNTAPVCEDKSVKGTNARGGALTLESSILMKAYFYGLTEGMTAKVSFTDYRGELVEKELGAHSDGYFAVNQIVAADGRQMVTVTVYNADGSVYGTFTDSMESYTARAHAAGNAVAVLADAVMCFSDSARNYLLNRK